MTQTVSDEKLKTHMTGLGVELLRSVLLAGPRVRIPLAVTKTYSHTPPAEIDHTSSEVKYKALAQKYSAAAREYYGQLVAGRDHGSLWNTVIRAVPQERDEPTAIDLDALVTRAYPGVPFYALDCVGPLLMSYHLAYAMSLDPGARKVLKTTDHFEFKARQGEGWACIEARGSKLASTYSFSKGRRKDLNRYVRTVDSWQGQSVAAWCAMPTKAFTVPLGVRTASAAAHLASRAPHLTNEVYACMSLAELSGTVSYLLRYVEWQDAEPINGLDQSLLRDRLLRLVKTDGRMTLRQQLFTLVVPHTMDPLEFRSLFGYIDEPEEFPLEMAYVMSHINRLTGKIK